MIQSPKLILTIVWGTMSFHVLAALLNGIKFNMTYYTNEILERINELRNLIGTRSARILLVHADTARLHAAKLSLEFLAANHVRKTLYLPYSPDLTLFNFYLFKKENKY
jgi:hypothetical protein